MRKCLVAGVAMVKFTKPGQQQPYFVMAAEAMGAALDEAGLAIADVQQAYAAYNHEGSAAGQSGLYELSRTGIPVFNLRNACAAGSSAIFLARQAIRSGAADCVVAVGFEEMSPGALPVPSTVIPSVHHILKGFADFGIEIDLAVAGPAMFGAAGAHYLKTHGGTPELFARVAVKSRAHAANNPYALFNKPLTVEEVMAAPIIVPPYLTRLMACPPTCGAAAVVLVSEEFARRHGLDAAVEIVGQGMTSDMDDTYDNPTTLVGTNMSRRAARMAFEEAGIGPEDIDVVELHDCFAPNELITYDALGLCATGEAEKFILDGQNSYGGRVVVNPSGGLMSKGHPTGATGLAQCFELVNQVRGTADRRQVPDARIAVQHNIGLGGTAVVTVYKQA